MLTSLRLRRGAAGADRHRAGTTNVAVALILALTVLFLVWSVLTLGSEGDRLTEEAVLAGLTTQTSQAASRLSAGMVLLVCLLTAGMGIGIARRSTGARYAAIVVFAFLGVVALASSVSGLMADPPAPNAGYGLLTALVDLAIVALLLARSTAEDFGMAELERERRQARG